VSETILTNARLILENEVITGTITFDAQGIKAVDQGNTAVPGAEDVGGDFIAPGLVEMHTDNMEKHFMPRPKVFWPNGLAAALVHDAQMAAAGVTTVYDAVCAGTPFSSKDYRKDIFGDIMDALAQGKELGVFRIDHHIHMRCELTSPDLMVDIEPYADNPLVRLVSLMDHTPGQRQWRNIDHLRTYSLGTGKSAEEFETDLEERAREAHNVPTNWSAVVAMFHQRGIPIATHDDTTVDHVEAGVASLDRRCEGHLRDLAQQGCKLIFTTSFGYMDQTLEVAKEFPDAYLRYIINGLRESFGLVGTPIRLHLKASDNPFAKRKKK
jgi:alpha-D-ribose 1-methylphosphonate 5-triphosphate diphosphatase